MLDGEDVKLGAESGDEATEMEATLELFGGDLKVGNGALSADAGPVCSIVDGSVLEREGA